MNKKILIIVLLIIFIIFIVNFALLLKFIPNNKDERIKLEKNTQNEVNNNNNNNIVTNNISENDNFKIPNEENNTNENSNITPDENSLPNNNIPNTNNALPNIEQNQNTNNNSNESQSNQNNNSIEKERINATKEYYCIGDSTLEGDKCVTTYSMDPIKQYFCEDGQLSGSKCKITSKKSLPINQYSGSYESCLNRGLSGYNLFSCACSAMGGTIDGYASGDYKCLKNITTEVDATLKYSCVEGTTLIDNKCVAIFSVNAGYNYSCPTGYFLVGTMCEKQ